LRKEDHVAAIIKKDTLSDGLVCVLACVESCMAPEVHKNCQTHKLELRFTQRKCRFFYFYFLHPQFGLMHVRLQSWLPFEVQVCINGRSYLQRPMDRQNIGYSKADNCFLRIDDLPKAQQLMDALTSLNWHETFEAVVAPLLEPLRAPGGPLEDSSYYWTIRQSEYATDIMFRDKAALREVYPHLCQHAIRCFGSRDIMRFLGHKPQSVANREIFSTPTQDTCRPWRRLAKICQPRRFWIL
jgi:hypothetical protein